jgi:hypothetical protein
MAKDHLEQLEKARAKLVEARHQRAREIAMTSGVLSDALPHGMTKIQEAIEAIDRAIEDEE